MISTCQICGTDVNVEYDEDNNVALCRGPGHPDDRMWEPSYEKQQPERTGIAFDLGLYDDLPKCLRPGEWAETGVVEHRYGIMRPDNYRWMVDRWSHTAYGPQHYTVTSFIGSTLGDLTRIGDVTAIEGKGSGFFDYNPKVFSWTLRPSTDDMTFMTWERYANEHDFDPDDWPLLGYKASDNK